MMWPSAACAADHCSCEMPNVHTNSSESPRGLIGIIPRVCSNLESGIVRVRELRADLAHVEATIRILRPGIELEKVVPRHVEFRPRHFKRGALAKLVLNYMRQHADDAVAVADMMPLVVAGRTLNAAEYQRAAVGVYEALRRAE